MGNERVQANAAPIYLGEGSNGDLAAAAQFLEQRTFAGGGGAGGAIIQKRQERPRCRVAVANFDCQGALSSGGGHHFHGDDLPNQLRLAQTVQARGRQNDGIVVAGFEFVQARIHIAAERVNLKIWTKHLQLGLTAQAAGTNSGPQRQRFDAGELHGTKNVAWIFAGGNSGNFEIRRQFRGQVFQAVHGEVNPVFDQGLFDFLGEHALGADFGKRNVGDFIAGGFDDLDLNGVAASAHQVDDSCRFRIARRRLQGADRRMHDFVDDAASQRLDGEFLVGGHGTEAATNPINLGLANGFEVVLQADDGGNHVESLQTRVKFFHLTVDDRLRLFRFHLAIGDVRTDRLLQIVD